MREYRYEKGRRDNGIVLHPISKTSVKRGALLRRPVALKARNWNKCQEFAGVYLRFQTLNNFTYEIDAIQGFYVELSK